MLFCYCFDETKPFLFVWHVGLDVEPEDAAEPEGDEVGRDRADVELRQVRPLQDRKRETGTGNKFNPAQHKSMIFTLI